MSLPGASIAIAALGLFLSTASPINVDAGGHGLYDRFPVCMEHRHSGKSIPVRKLSSNAPRGLRGTSLWHAILKREADSVYRLLDLAEKGLSRSAFEYGWKGFRLLKEKGLLARDEILTICDLSQSSRNKRLYIFDTRRLCLLMNTYVAHGRNSGGEFAYRFSNQPKSRQTSLGFYVTRNTYFGEHGLSLKIEGLERGFNDHARSRHIVVHGSGYLGDDFMENNPFNGRSYGCPAVPSRESDFIIQTIKEGSCLFIYHPTQKYLSRSRIING